MSKELAMLLSNYAACAQRIAYTVDWCLGQKAFWHGDVKLFGAH